MIQKVKNQLLKTLYTQQSIGYKYSEMINTSLLCNENENNKFTEDDVENCNLCDLYKLSDKKIVFNGDKSSKVIILSTKALCNDAEVELLNKMLMNVLGAKPESFYYLSLLKCNIENGVTYTKEQIERCQEFFDKQLSLSNAKLIIALGDSYNLLTNNESDLYSVRGKTYQYKHYQLIPLYEPSLILRNPSLKKEVFEDLKKIKLIMDRM
jgi:DNA polymerase